VEKLGAESRLPLIDLAIASLKDLSKNQYTAFNANVKHLVEADEQIDLFEFTLQRMLMRHLEPAFSNVKKPSIQYYSIQPILPHITKLLSCLAYWGAEKSEEAVKAFNIAIQRIEKRNPPEIAPADLCGLDTLDKALNVLIETSPGAKKRIIEACTACIAADGRVTIEEAELLRAVADSLDCPIPPFAHG
jgi:hypothetical protein